MALTAFLTDTLGLTEIPPHLPIILWSTLGFTVVHLVLSPFLLNRLFPIAYGTKGPAAKNNWAIHVVSLVHLLIIVPLALWSVYTEAPDRAVDKAFGWSDRTGFVHGIAVGYFIWDTIDAIVNFVDAGFVVHGFVCSLVYTMSYRPFVAYYATRCLLWEISTLFLNIHWFLDKTNRTGSRLQLINGILLISSFFCVRLVYGGYVCFSFFFTLAQVWRDIPWFYIVIYGGGNIMLQGLNVFWFSKMIAALRKRFDGSKSKSNGTANGSERTRLLNNPHSNASSNANSSVLEP